MRLSPLKHTRPRLADLHIGLPRRLIFPYTVKRSPIGDLSRIVRTSGSDPEVGGVRLRLAPYLGLFLRFIPRFLRFIARPW